MFQRRPFISDKCHVVLLHFRIKTILSVFAFKDLRVLENFPDDQENFVEQEKITIFDLQRLAEGFRVFLENFGGPDTPI